MKTIYGPWIYFRKTPVKYLRRSHGRDINTGLSKSLCLSTLVNLAQRDSMQFWHSKTPQREVLHQLEWFEQMCSFAHCFVSGLAGALHSFATSNAPTNLKDI